VDAEGAEALRRRIEQQTHWRQAEAVRDGRQPAVDPDSDELAGVHDGIRLYTPRTTHGEVVHPCKRLVDGVWVSETLAQHEAEARRSPPDVISRVA